MRSGQLVIYVTMSKSKASLIHEIIGKWTKDENTVEESKVHKIVWVDGLDQNHIISRAKENN